MGPSCEAIVTLDGSELKDGDYAGLCFLISSYGFIATYKGRWSKLLGNVARVTTDDKSIFGNLVDSKPGTEYARIPVNVDKVTLKAYGNFVDNIDECEFYYRTEKSGRRLV